MSCCTPTQLLQAVTRPVARGAAARVSASASSSTCYRAPPATPSPRRRFSASTLSSFASAPSSPSGSGSRLYAPAVSVITQHVEQLLASAGVPNPSLPADVVEQACTHKSAVSKGGDRSDSVGASGHGEKLGFLGRRVLRLHLTLYLSTALAHNPSALAQYLSQDSVDSLLETRELGANVGRAWSLENVMRWREVRGPNGEMTGLYKSRGATVEALVGAVYSQRGIAASHAIFERLVLPNLALPTGLARAIERSTMDTAAAGSGPEVVANGQQELRRVAV